MKPDCLMTEEELLANKGVRTTPNRILVARTLRRSLSPMSLSQLETELSTVDKSSIFRVLSLFVDHGIVHVVEGGDNVAKYELCHGEDHCSLDDMHIHFYCTECHRTFCFADIPVPKVECPEGFRIRNANYMAKGLCPECSRK